MPFTLLHGYSYIVLGDGSYSFKSNVLNGVDTVGLASAFIAVSPNSSFNFFGVEEIALGTFPVSSRNNWYRYEAGDATFAYTLSTATGAEVSILQFLREDRSAGEFFIMDGTRSDFTPDTDGFDELIHAMEATPPVPLAIGHTFDLTAAPARVYDSVNYNDLPGHASQLILRGSQNNMLRMGDGADTVQAGDGDDWVSASGSYPGSRSSLHGNAFTEQNLSGEAGNDTLKFVDDGAGVISGGTGNDRIFGGTSVDWLFGDEGDDLIFGLGGDDVMDSGRGNDRLYGGDGDDAITNEYGYVLIRGGDGDDDIQSVNLDATGLGASRLYGDSGNDIIRVSDRAPDGSVAAYVDGGDGDDHITVENEAHVVLRGGSGADTFEYQTDAAPARIHDFEPGLDLLDARDLLGWTDFATLIANAEEKSYGVKLNGMENDVYLVNATLGDLSAGDFLL